MTQLFFIEQFYHGLAFFTFQAAKNTADFLASGPKLTASDVHILEFQLLEISSLTFCTNFSKNMNEL